LIFSSPLLSVPLWRRDADILIASLPAETREAIRRHEETGTYDSPEYRAAMEAYYRHFVIRRMPRPPDVEKCFSEMNPAVYKPCGGRASSR
jgi:hypothetical protein